MRFQCQPGCVRCCEREGFVYVTEEDIARLAGHLKMSRAEFHRRFLCGSPPLLRFRQSKARPCPFLRPEGCSVHAVKPLQCASFPCWPELLDKASERREAAQYCPGINRGPRLDPEAARATAERVRQAFPLLYERQG